jgi:REP element-mobilizing transposase RayT
MLKHPATGAPDESGFRLRQESGSPRSRGALCQMLEHLALLRHNSLSSSPGTRLTMPHWILFYHLVWTTKYRQPLITPPIETLLYATIRDVSQKLRSSLMGVNGTLDHVHAAVSIPPSLSVAEWVGKVKGESAYIVNTAYPGHDPHFQWQQGYSAHRFGPQGRDLVLDYIARQKDHHAQGSLIPGLEYVIDESKRPPKK